MKRSDHRSRKRGENDLRGIKADAMKLVKIDDIKIGRRFRKTIDRESEDFERLAESIRDRGMIHPLIIDGDKNLIIGYRRYNAAREIGLEEIPVRIMNFNEPLQARVDENVLRKDYTPLEKVELAKAIRKKTSIVERAWERKREAGRKYHRGAKKKGSSEYDKPFRVDEEVARVVNWSRDTLWKAEKIYDYARENPDKYGDLLEGMNKKNISSLFNELERRLHIEERIEKAKDIRLKNLLYGDCLDRITEIEDKSIDMVLTDPPYGLGHRHFGPRGQIEKFRKRDYPGEDDSIYPLLDSLFEKMKPKLKDNAHIYIFNHWKTWHKLREVVHKHFHIMNCIVWEKTISLGGRGEKYNYRSSYGLILFADKKEGTERKISRDKNLIRYNEWKDKMPISYHKALKPLELCKLLIESSTLGNETVFDPFAGSGTTLVAAEELGRSWIGIEIEKEYCDIAKTRIEEAQNG